ncbi:hypothetical protein HPC49_39005 [Pyxidicoccus fallax]|uniref:DUF202 domain-containing protein n=1 Tax=Pyxidicoccus fallax TaxID=394095 RepID=A0A848LT78_9BACT|nr:hypothetical protein [Pyxidicoccus fallax]NMO20604.1 hypothetical protein [Pyxidicoccus fallax]NPC84189.1 hypothetical protein [Pyxidicoccus fallax]
MSADTQDLRTQLDRLQESLSVRQSTTHFAHAGVSTIAALLIGGAAGKLFYDSLRTPFLAWGAALLSLGLVVYAFSRYRAGRKVLAEELKGYESMLELRRQLRLDDPAALLPR